MIVRVVEGTYGMQGTVSGTDQTVVALTNPEEHTASNVLRIWVENPTEPFVPNALVGADGVTVTSGDPIDTVSGFYTEFVAASGTLDSNLITVSGHLQSEIDAVEASDVDSVNTFTGDIIIAGADGNTIINDDPTITVSGFRTEFVSASGSLQTQIDAVEGSDVDSINSLIGDITITGSSSFPIITEGQVITISGADFLNNLENAYDGSIGLHEEQTYAISSDGETITFTLDDIGGSGGHTVQISGTNIEHEFPDTVTLTAAGTDSNPQENWVYLLESGPLTTVLTANTTGFPPAPHARVARVIVQTAATVQTSGPLKLHAYTDHTAEPDTRGSIGHIHAISERIRAQFAEWQSGTELSTTPAIGSSAATLSVQVDPGYVYQLHNHATPALDTAGSDRIFVLNDYDEPYKIIQYLSDLDEYNNDDTIGTTHRFNVVLWGVVAENDSDTKLFLNLPSQGYNKDTTAIADSDNTAVYTIPRAFAGVGWLLARLTVKRSGAGGNTWEIIENHDLRGATPSTFPGGIAIGGAGVTDHPLLTNLSFAAAGHTGFASSDDTSALAASGVATDAQVTANQAEFLSASGTLVKKSGDTMTGALEVQDTISGTRVETPELYGGGSTAEDLILGAFEEDSPSRFAGSLGQIAPLQTIRLGDGTGIEKGLAVLIDIPDSVTMSGQGTNVNILCGFRAAGAVEINSTQTLTLAATFESLGKFRETAAIGAPGAFDTLHHLGFSASPVYSIAHDGDSDDRDSLVVGGYGAAPACVREDGYDEGTTVISEMAGFVTNPRFALRSIFGEQQIKPGFTINKYVHFEANSDLSGTGLAIAAGAPPENPPSTITEEVGLDLQEIKQGITANISVRSTASEAEMRHAGTIVAGADRAAQTQYAIDAVGDVSVLGNVVITGTNQFNNGDLVAQGEVTFGATSGTEFVLPLTTHKPQLHILNTTNNFYSFVTTQYDPTYGTHWVSNYAKGTQNNPDPVISGSIPLILEAFGWTGTQWGRVATINFQVDKDVAPDDVPGRIVFAVHDGGIGTDATTAATIDSDLNLTVVGDVNAVTGDFSGNVEAVDGDFTGTVTVGSLLALTPITDAEKSAIPAPGAGDCIFNSTSGTVCVNDGNSWRELAYSNSVTLQDSYEAGDGIITTITGKPLELQGTGELVAVTGTFTEGITIG